MRIGIAVLCGAMLAAQTVPETVGKLTVDGDVSAPLTLTVADLAKLPRETVTLAEMDGGYSDAIDLLVGAICSITAESSLKLNQGAGS